MPFRFSRKADTHLTLVDERSSIRSQVDDRLHLDLPHCLVDVLHLLRDADHLWCSRVPMINIISIAVASTNDERSGSRTTAADTNNSKLALDEMNRR